MKTVPTLCATATVVGASAVGLGIGRTPLDVPHTNSNKKAAALARDSGLRSMPTAVQTLTTTTTAPSFSAPISVAPSSRMSVATRISQDGRPQRRIARRMTSDNVTLPSSSVNVYAPSDLGDVPSRRTSWIKRLSGISTSQHSSRASSPVPPLSPSIACSNGSMAFSRDGSTAPIVVGTRAPSPTAPNKLVKRSSSVRAPHEAPPNSSGLLRPTFRRPATSHARSATLQHHSVMLEMTAEAPSVDDLPPTASSTDSEAEYAQFFTARVAKEKTLAKRTGFSAGARGFRRIFADEKHKPVLVLARSVSSGALEMDRSTSEDGESTYFVSRPGTPFSMRANMVTSTAEPPNYTESQRAPDAPQHAVRPRRSFSVTELLTSVTTAKTQRLTARLSRKVSQRVKSAPLVPTMGRRRSSTSHAEHAARSDLSTEAVLAGARREIATSSGVADPGFTHSHGGSQGFGGSSLSPSLVPDDSSLAGVPQLNSIAPAASTANQPSVSPSLLAGSAVHPSRFSMAPSEQASTLVDSSDSDLRALGFCDEDDAGYQSDTVYDSLRTDGATRSVSGATRSTSGGARGPRIETIFDESPPSKTKVTALQDLLPSDSFEGYEANGTPGQQSISEEDESISTPVRTVRPEFSPQGTPNTSRTHSAPLFPKLAPSSPPDMPKPLSLGTLEWDSRAGDDDSSTSHLTTPVSLRPQKPRMFAPGPSPKPVTTQRLVSDHGDKDARSSIFDWSEQPADKSSGNRTPPRPRTVHGKKDVNRRDSRSVGRRVPSGLHARSQSVPVVPDAAGKRSAVVTNKFGTWGVGSKGVTEDWNDDFDFSDLNEDPVAESLGGSNRIDSGTVMIVPKTIQEQQNNVLANIGLLREWGLLIEELKEHRVRAVALDIVEGQHSGMWEEVDAMIDLADQEADHEGVPHLSPRSSMGFDEDAFEDVTGTSPNVSRVQRKSGSPNADFGKNSPSVRPRRSILPPNDDIFAPQSSPIPPKAKQNAPVKAMDHKPIITRPRKDSEAKARSVIEALQKRRSIYEPVGDIPPTPSSKKVPFDTATLRRIVPYVATLTHKVKDAIRHAEGLYSSPSTSPMQEDPPFSSVFRRDADLATDVAAQLKLMTVM